MKVYFSKCLFGSYTLRHKLRRYSERIYKQNMIKKMFGVTDNILDLWAFIPNK
jgi:hypothetical protein